MSRILTVFISLSFVLTACAHDRSAATAAPETLAKAKPAPQAQPAPLAPEAKKAETAPRQYEGPPPNRKPVPVMAPYMKVTGRKGWQLANQGNYQMLIQHQKTEGTIAFFLRPTMPVGLVCAQLAAAARKVGAKTTPLRLSADGLSSYFSWHQYAKKGKKRQLSRGKILVQVAKNLPAATVVMIGQWPGRHDRLMRREFDAFARTTEIFLKPLPTK